MFTHSAAHLGFIADCGVSLYLPRQLKVTTAERHVIISDGLVSDPGSGETGQQSPGIPRQL